MNQNKEPRFTQEALLSALSSYFGEKIIQATKRRKRLHGGTVGEVFLVQEKATTSSSKELPYKIIWKYTQKWNRPGDPLLWRREYDWFHFSPVLNLGEYLHLPTCYYQEITEEGNHLWMEYLTGASGNSLTLAMLQEIAFQWGIFQQQNMHSLKSLEGKNTTNLSFLDSELSQWYHNPYDYDFLCSDQCLIPSHIKNTLRKNNWRGGFSIIYHYIRSDECDLPEHLKQMITHLNDSREEIFLKFSQLPEVISHRDFWIENIFYKGPIINIIDWDCVGEGYLGEDIASLIADDTPTRYLNQWFEPIFSSYRQGFLTNGKTFPLEKKDVVMMILIKYGYRLMGGYWFADSQKEKDDFVERLSIIYGWLKRY